MTRARTALIAVGLAAAALGIAVDEPQPAGAVTATVATPAELVAAFADPLVDRIEISSDIDLTCPDRLLRPPLAPVVTISGGGHVLVDLCTELEATTVSSGSIAIEDIEIVGPAAPSGSVLRGGEVHVTGSHIVSRGTEAALSMSGSGDIADTVFDLEDGGAVRGGYDGAGGLVVERVTITGDGDGLSWSALAPVAIRDATIATTGQPVNVDGEVRIERSALRNGYGSSVFRSPTVIVDSTLAVDPALDRPQLPLSAPVTVQPGGEVVLQQTTVLSLADDPTDSPASLRVETGGRLTLAGSAVGIGPGSGARACRGGGTFVSGGGNVVVGDTCPQVAGDQVVDDLGLEPYDPATGVASPSASSPVLDAVAACLSDRDQLGQPRPSGTACDAGAVELQVATPPPTSSTTSSVPGSGPGSPARPATPVVGPARFTG